MKNENKKTNMYQPDERLKSEVTPEGLYFSRRELIKKGLVAAGALTLAACGIPPASNIPDPAVATGQASQGLITANNVDELGAALTPYDTVTHFNNFYEFSLDKEAVADRAKGFVTQPWQIQIGGLVKNPMTLSMEQINKNFAAEERVYRLRCVEGWSMVIPWNGFQLSHLLEQVEPQPDAKYVYFETTFDSNQMPGLRDPGFPWPYTEGLRLDEAMNPLTLLATGIYGKPLPPQDGAPIRLVVPWKYGFKSIKSIVKINLVNEQPATLWSSVAPNEYGFFANVNPDVSHPRWSQATERRLGEISRRPTLKFNGYEKEVAYLYEGMDLAVNY
ncbi:MAG: protein-methionine-sulfoxide reductase catalytic subunit MsrP [Anaerolineae bacterium]|nr:protein-methionine-sulfoxide reductase catalytic subunit MsrP [Anaerolineae bacterium]